MKKMVLSVVVIAFALVLSSGHVSFSGPFQPCVWPNRCMK